jgi:transposase
MLAKGGRRLPARSRRLTGRYECRPRPDQERIAWRKQQGACFVIGTNIDASQVSDLQVIQAYKAQSQVESGFRFLKDPLFFVSSLFVKKPCRIQGLLMVMTLALLVYAVTQRRLRGQLVWQHDTIPNQINQPTERPTLRWVFQLLEGIHRVRVTVQDQAQDVIEGLNEVQIKVLRLFGEEVCQLYQIAPG